MKLRQTAAAALVAHAIADLSPRHVRQRRRRLLACSGEQVQARLQLADALAAATSKDHQPAGVDDTPTSAATSHASSR